MQDIPTLVDGLFRRESARLVSSLTRVFGPARIDLAEDVVQETLLRALRAWPRSGIPDSPAAWLQRVAQNLAIDRLRTETSLASRAEGSAQSLRPDASQSGRLEDIVRTDSLEDDELRMICVCCHPALSPESQVALTLKLLCGFGVEEIARGLREKPATIAQRIVRAKQAIRDHGLSFESPLDGVAPSTPPSELAGRSRSHEGVASRTAILHTLYLLFNEGYTATGGPDLVRDHLCREAIRLAEMVARHPALGGPEVDALLALFYFQAARLPARVDGAGDLLLLAEQDRSLWDTRLVEKGFQKLKSAQRAETLTRYHLEAGIASIHAAAPDYSQTDWPPLVELYDALLEMTGSPIVALNRAVAVGMAQGPEAGLRALAPLEADSAMASFHLYHAVIAELELRCGRPAEAARAYQRALECNCSEPERRFLEARLKDAAHLSSHNPQLGHLPPALGRVILLHP
jgi:RNA polymerase sigma-70 factor (ECF subfamily)